MGNWHVIVVDGPERELRAFVAGFLADRTAAQTAVVFGHDVGLEQGSLLAPDDLATPLAAAIAERGRALGLRVAERKSVARATFAMHAEAHARNESAQLRSALRGAPMSQHSESEQEHAATTGGSPVHSYTYRVQATVNGPVGAVLDVRRRLAEVAAARIEPLQLA